MEGTAILCVPKPFALGISLLMRLLHMCGLTYSAVEGMFIPSCAVQGLALFAEHMKTLTHPPTLGGIEAPLMMCKGRYKLSALTDSCHNGSRGLAECGVRHPRL